MIDISVCLGAPARFLGRCAAVALLALVTSCGGSGGGYPAKGEFLVNTTAEGDQFHPAIATLRGGGYVVAWTTASDVYLQRFDATGAPSGNEVKLGIDQQVNPADTSVTGLEGGGYAVAWTGFSPDRPLHGGRVFVQAFDASGDKLAGQAPLTAAVPGADGGLPAVVALEDGGYLVAWRAFPTSTPGFPGIHARRFSPAGAPDGTPIELVAPARGAWLLDVCALPGGGQVVAWMDADAMIHAQRFTAAGDRLGGESYVGAASAVSGDGLAVAVLIDGGYVVAWRSQATIQARRFDREGVPIGAEEQVNGAGTGDLVQPDVAALADGGYVVTWLAVVGSDWRVHSQRFDSTGTRRGGETLVNSTVSGLRVQPTVAGLASAGHVVTWAAQFDASGFGIFAQQFDAAGARR